MKRGLSVAVLLLVVYLMVQNAECKNNRIQEYLLVEGTDVDKLTDGELYGLLDAEDEKFIGQHDIWIGKQILKDQGPRSRSWSGGSASRRSGSRSRNWSGRKASRRSGSRSRNWSGRKASRRSGSRSRNWSGGSVSRRSGSRSSGL